MKKDPGLVGLIAGTACVALINISNLLEYLDTGYIGKPLSSLFFAASIICVVIGWIMYFYKEKKSKK